MFSRTAKNRERKLSEKPNDLTQSLPAEFLGDARLWKSLIKTRRQRNGQGIPQNSCERTQKFRHFSDNWSGCLSCWGGALYILQRNALQSMSYLLQIKTGRCWYHHQQLKQEEPGVSVQASAFAYSNINNTKHKLTPLNCWREHNTSLTY